MTIMQLPPREDNSYETSRPTDYDLPEYHPVYKNVHFMPPKLVDEFAVYNVEKERQAKRMGRDFQPVRPYLRHGMLELLETLAAKRPLWRFVGSGFVSSGFISAFDVFDGEEKLGKLDHTLNYNYRVSSTKRVDEFKLYNDRINSKLDRRDHKTTGKVSIAVTTVLKEFGAKTNGELIVDAKQQLAKVATELSMSAERKMTNAAWDLRPKMTEDFIANPEVYAHRPWYEVLGKKYLEAAMVDSKATELKNRITNMQAGRIVIQRDDTYIIVDNVNSAVYTHQTLPFDVRSKLGMLKLVDPETYLDGVGVKTKDTGFYYILNNEK